MSASGEGREGPRIPPGLQAERTTLAWVRTALVCGGLATVAVHVADSSAERVVALFLGALVAMSGLLAAWLRVGSLERALDPSPTMRTVCPTLLAASVVLADVAVLATMLL